MNKVRSHFQILLLASWLLTGVILTAPPTGAGGATEKMNPEEVVAKHLASIGSAEARASVRSRFIVGTAEGAFRGRGSGSTNGRAVLASEGVKNLVGMAFATPDYPGEKVGFDGQNLTVGYVRPGVRSSLGSFLLIHETVFKHGLIGGALSSAWPLLDLVNRDAKIEYAGDGKVGGKQMHKLRYRPRKGSELRVILFFDAETFRHVRTEYERVVDARMGASGVDSSASQRETRYQMVEEFAEFAQEGALTLPHLYKIQLSIESTNGSIFYHWTLDLKQFTFNRPIAPGDFNVNSY
jgi:hypothetical protein